MTMTRHQPTGALTCPTPTGRWRRWLDLRVFRVGAVSGLLGGLCCIAGAIAVGSGLAGLSAVSRLMDRYQPYFIAASVLMMAWWLLRALRGQSQRLAGRQRVAIVVRGLGRRVAPMGITYAITLMGSMAVSQLLR
jgi:hypothetical protein